MRRALKLGEQPERFHEAAMESFPCEGARMSRALRKEISHAISINARQIVHRRFNHCGQRDHRGRMRHVR
jgi:hypothetical protein